MQQVEQKYSSNLEIPFTEKLKGIPGIFGIRLAEEPDYYVLRSEGEKQMRKYGAQTLASITLPLNGDHDEAEESAFTALAAYIFGQNTLAHHIPMTAPVLKEVWMNTMTMSFILPQKYLNSPVPQPLDKRILLHHMPVHNVAAINYSGQNDEEKIQAKTQELRQWVNQFKSYRITTDSQIVQYDGPMTLDFLRKNEIHLGIKCLN